MEENLIQKPNYSEKSYLSVEEKKSKSETESKSEKDDYYDKEQKVPINGVGKNMPMKPQVFSVSGLSKIAKERSENEIEEQKFDEQKAEEWVEEWLPEELIDAYALSYEKSQKSPEKKRKNKKYQKYYKKCQEEIKNYLKHRLRARLLSGKLEEDASDEQVKGTILKMLKSDLRATRLFKIMKNHDYQQTEKAKEKVDSNINPEKNQSAESEENLVLNQTGKPDGPDDKKTDSNKLNQEKIPETKEEFFQQFPFIDYVNKKDGSDLKILNYNPETQEVSIYQYQSFVYNKENDSWGPAEKRGQEKTIKYQDFLELMKDYSSDQNLEETEKNPERIQLRGFYINEKGEFFKPKEYFVRKNKEGREEKFIEIEIDKNVNGSKNPILSSDNYHKFIKRGGYSFYDNGKDMEEAFNKKLERLKSEVQDFEIFGIYYHSGEGKYLVKIKKSEQKAEYVSFKKLLEMVKEDKNKKEDEKNIDLSNHFEQDEIGFINDVLGRYIRDYKQDLEEYLENQQEILGKALVANIKEKYLKYFWDKELGEKLNSIQDVISLEKKEIVLNYLQNQFK
jgi:hypothetical protein